MRIALYRALWGVTKVSGGRLSIPQALKAVRALGAQYRGVEVPIRTIAEFGRNDFVAALRENDLKVIPVIFTDGPMAPGYGDSRLKGHSKPARAVARHVELFKEQLYECLQLPPAVLSKVTAHSGLDAFSTGESVEFFEKALTFQHRNVPPHLEVNHETHRHRILYSPWVTRDLLRALPFPAGDGLARDIAAGTDAVDDTGASAAKAKATAKGKKAAASSASTSASIAPLTFVADYSHHVNVTECSAEELGGELTAVFDAMAPRVRHVHARYGYDQSPQCPDPRAPEYAPYVAAHDAWWTTVVRNAWARGAEELTVTPEHGPAPYQQSLPYSTRATASIWDVNTWVGERFLDTAKRALHGLQSAGKSKAKAKAK